MTADLEYTIRIYEKTPLPDIFAYTSYYYYVAQNTVAKPYG